MNYDSAQFDLKDRVTRFTHINTRKFVMMFGDETPSDGTKKYWWSWSRDGRLFSEGLKYSLRVNLILRNATATPVTWRFYCETKKNNFTSHYFWDKTGADVNKQVGAHSIHTNGEDGKSFPYIPQQLVVCFL